MNRSMCYVDLHAHTNVSDGTLSPTELVRLALEKGLAAIAITDHDTTAGVMEAMREGERIGIRVIPGIEMSTKMEGCDIHLVGLYVDIHNGFKRPKCEKLPFGGPIDRSRRRYQP